MSRTLKWILGILAVLVIVAIAAGAVWAWQNRAQLVANNRPYAARPNVPQGQQPMPFGFRGFNDDGGRTPMGRWGFRGPMMGGRGRFGPMGLFGMGLFFLRGFFRLLIPLALLAVVAILFYQMGRRAAAPVQRPSAPPPPTNEPRSD